MRKMMIFLVALFLAFTLSLTICSGVASAGYPTRPITNIVSWAAGGPTDISQRILASVLPRYLNTTMVIENQAGGAAVPGTTAIARSAPDGYTIGVNWGASFTLRPRVMDVPYRIEDFDFLLGLAVQRNVIAVNADSPFETLEDLISYTIENPGALIFSGGAVASQQQMIAVILLDKAGGEATFIPHDGSRPSAVAMMGGHLDFAVVEPATIFGEVDAGLIRVLAVFEEERLSHWPDVPTAREAGFDVAFPHTMMLVAPAGIPSDIREILVNGLTQAVQNEEFIELAINAGLDPSFKTGEEVKAELAFLESLLPDNLAELLER